MSILFYVNAYIIAISNDIFNNYYDPDNITQSRSNCLNIGHDDF